MALSDPLRQEVVKYASKDLAGDMAWHVDYFDFVQDEGLRKRLGQEFYSARFLYKLWEGLRVDEPWAVQAQVQLQVQQYASIYEAVIHYLLFTVAAGEPAVQQLREYTALTERRLPDHIMERVQRLGSEDASEIVGAKYAPKRIQESKVRFDEKIKCCVNLGILEGSLAEEIQAFYTARNYIHIHAELKHEANPPWEVDFSRDAYRRLQPFKEQIAAWLKLRAASDSSLA